MPDADTHPLDYLGGPPFGWRETGDNLILVLPPRPRWEVATESTSILVASTGFLLIYAVVAIVLGRQMPPDMPSLRVVLVLVGLLAIGQWVLVVVRIAAMLHGARIAGRIAVGPDGLSVSDALPPGPRHQWWPPGDVASIRLDRVDAILGKVRRVRLQVASTEGVVSAYVFAWPAGLSTEPYQQRLREALAAQPKPAVAEVFNHAQPDPDQARVPPGEAWSAAGDLGAIGEGPPAVQAAGPGDPRPRAGGGADEHGAQGGADR